MRLTTFLSSRAPSSVSKVKWLFGGEEDGRSDFVILTSYFFTTRSPKSTPSFAVILISPRNNALPKLLPTVPSISSPLFFILQVTELYSTRSQNTSQNVSNQGRAFSFLGVFYLCSVTSSPPLLLLFSHGLSVVLALLNFGVFKIYLFLAVLGLWCWGLFSSCEQCYSLVAAHRLPTAVAPLVAEHRL